jgi:hypothetical protein
MVSVKEIESAIKKLNKDELAALREWFEEFAIPGTPYLILLRPLQKTFVCRAVEQTVRRPDQITAFSG